MHAGVGLGMGADELEEGGAGMESEAEEVTGSGAGIEDDGRTGSLAEGVGSGVIVGVGDKRA